MNTTIILIIAAGITLFSLLLKFINTTMENVSIFRDIQKKNSEILNMISKLKLETDRPESIKHVRLALSDWFSGLAIVLVSFKLIMEYVDTDIVTRDTVFHVGLLFSLLLFNLIFISISTIERRLGYWIDEFMAIFGYIFEQIQVKQHSGSKKKLDSTGVQTPPKKRKRTKK